MPDAATSAGSLVLLCDHANLTIGFPVQTNHHLLIL